MKHSQPFITLSNGSPGFRRSIHPEVKIIDAKNGICDYIASDETIDSYREVVRASGWRFTHFKKNAPFVDSHNYSTLEHQLGSIIDYRVEGGKLIERAKWAIDVPENKLAILGWKMTEAGYLKAVSVGFFPVRYVSKWECGNPDLAAQWATQLKELGMNDATGVRTIYMEQEQIELSACIIGANPNALAKAYKADVIGEADVEFIASKISESRSIAHLHSASEDETRETAKAAPSPALATWAREQGRKSFLEKVQKAVSSRS